MFSGERCPCGRLKELKSEQSLVPNPRNAGCWCPVSTDIATAGGSDCHLRAPLAAPLGSPNWRVSSNPTDQMPVWHCCPGGSCGLAAPAFQPLQGHSQPLSSGFLRALPSKAPVLIRARGKDSSRVCSEQELIKIQKVISLLCPLITGNPGRPDQTQTCRLCPRVM